MLRGMKSLAPYTALMVLLPNGGARLYRALLRYITGAPNAANDSEF